MVEVIWDTIWDCGKLIPFLFLTYLAMEWLEHKAGQKTQAFIERSGRFGPVPGALLGAIPQCGFSAAASNLYAGRVITIGTLLSIYLSTSDEMLPVLISESADPMLILRILALKVAIGMTAGLLVDFLYRIGGQGQEKGRRDAHGHGHEHAHIHEMCERDHCHCGEKKGIWRSALRHTLQIAAFLLVITFALNLAIHFVGEEALAGLILNRPVAGSLLAGVVGLIPNCASSVVITQLYLQGAMSFGAMMSGLLVGAGVGLLVLLRSNTDRKEDLKIAGILYGIGVLSGIVIDLCGVI
ncbi:MAG: arsenic efflux protein [Lachnospiraceae bacterium]|nr:arsenic efflux protein [Lachnospiraceae bacterium]